MTIRRTRAAVLPALLALALVAAACGSDDDAAATERPTAAPTPRPAAHRATAARRGGDRRRRHRRLHLRRPEGRLRLQPGRLRGQPGGRGGVPRRRGAAGRERARDRRVRSGHAGHDRPGRRPHLRHQLRPPRVRREPRRARTPTSCSSTRAASRPSRSTTSAPTSAPCTSPCTPPASPPAQVSETGKLGYVYAFPIPQTLANINAFTLGAQSVNPDIETIAVSTGSWCDPALQAQAAQSLLDQDVDVITQHQDCTKTIVEATEAAGAYSVGYHADASELAPNGWITGSEWDWARPLHRHRRRRSIDGDFADSDVQRRLPGRPADRRQPVHPVGLRLDGRPPRPIALIDAAKAVVRRRRLAVHRPGRRTRTATIVWAEGEHADLRRHRDRWTSSSRASSARPADRRSQSIGDAHRRHAFVR